jgi:hypothetical protein
MDRLDVEDGEELGDQVVERARLLDEGRRSQLGGPRGQTGFVEAAVHDNACLGRGSPHPGERFQPVHPRHRHVQEHERRAVLNGQLDRCCTVGAFADHVELS